MNDLLYCGAAKEKITPSPDILPFTFGLMKQKYGKVHDDLYLRVIALRSGKTSALIVVFDLDKATNPDEWTKILEAKTGVPAANILYLAIHTHTAPLTGYRPFEGPNSIDRQPADVQEKMREYEAFLLEKLVRAAREAIDSMTAARMGYGTGSCYIGMNRCCQYDVKQPDGTIKPELGIGYDPEGTVNHTLLAVRFENAETGKPIAFLTNYAVHCVAGFTNRCEDGKSFLSADIAGCVSREMEEEYPEAVALWTSAPAGDINPVNMIQTFYPDPITGAPVERHIVGEDAADAIITAMAMRELAAIRSVLRKIKCEIDSGDIRTAVDFAKTKCHRGIITKEIEECEDDYLIRTHLLQIGPLALIGIDGELYSSFGTAMKAASPVRDTFIINHDSSLRLDNPGYIIDDTTIARLQACDGRGSQRGGIPGGGTYTRPGQVKAALEESVQRLFGAGEQER